ncbi:hypothetical protein Ahy_B03g064729 [Arachis hypogaea]|uniref:Uncharacterized protein n=1 Tax=Arachis hypogaea TaxID=3818 RepID=A0A445A0A8_ARAHY|nr:hypothetical protein Ahy_B03g064729 [Arachis hypogaea]
MPNPNPPPKTVTQPSKTKPKNPPKKMSLPTEMPKPWSKSKETKKSAVPRRGTRNVKSTAPKPCGRRSLTRAAASGASVRGNGKGKQPQTEHVALSSSEDSSDSEASDGCEEDEPYGPDGDLVSSEEDVGVERLAGKKKTNVKERTRKAKKTSKQKRDVMVEDDGPVCADSGSEDDAHFFGPIPRFGSMRTYDDAQDEGYEESDGRDSWHSEELKTPPNSEDELEEKNCGKRAADEVAAAAVQPPAANGGEASVVPEPPTEIQLEASQPPLSQTDDSQEVLPPPVRPPKLPPKRKSSKQENATPGSSSEAATTQTAPTPSATTQPTTLPPSHPMQGASQGTVTRLFNFMKFVPNPGFRPPRNKK